MSKMLLYALVAGLVLAAVPLAANADVVTIDVSPATSTINLKQTVQFSAVALDGNEEPVEAEIAWSSDQDGSGITTVSASGLFKPRRAGLATITASSGDVDGTATVTVLDTLQVDAGMLTRAYANGKYGMLTALKGRVSADLMDGSTAGVAGFTARISQLHSDGTVLRGTYVTGATGADGSGTFDIPQLWTLPGTYAVTVEVFDGANSGADSFEYVVTY